MTAIQHVLSPILLPVVRRELAGRLDRASLRALIRDAFAGYDELRPQLPREATVGGRLMVSLAALTIGFYRALLQRGVSEEEGRELTARVTGRVYAQMARVPTVLSRVGARSRRDRLRRATDAFRRFPFGPPSYVMVDVAADPDVVAFDVHRCPVAEVFHAQELGTLCEHSWCNLDFPLAQRWGARLERGHTLAGGATCCDFRWRVTKDER